MDACEDIKSEKNNKHIKSSYIIQILFSFLNEKKN